MKEEKTEFDFVQISDIVLANLKNSSFITVLHQTITMISVMSRISILYGECEMTLSL